jgi:Raf kinase inhibitor-like YbhB/YbcL family protein
MALALKSPAFRNGDEIPERYIRQGGNASPPLQWDGAPKGTKSFALVVEDPDAPKGLFRHWAIYDLPPDQTWLAENVGRSGGAVFTEAVNDFGAAAYDGPQPPPGSGLHHYHFRLAALDVAHLELPPKARARDVWQAAKAHVIEEADLVATCEPD